MKRLLLSTLCWITISLAFCPIVDASPSRWINETMQPQEEPSYAKWGRYALNRVSERYGGEIIDYLHVGRKELSDKTVQEVFKFWLRDTNREFGVYVYITFEIDTEKVLTVQFQETTR